MDTYPSNNSEEEEKFLAQIQESVITAFRWALAEPDTKKYGSYLDLSSEVQEQVAIELVDEIKDYLASELGLPNIVIDDIYQDALIELDN